MNADKPLGQYAAEIYLFPKDLVRRDDFILEFSLPVTAEKLPPLVVTEERQLAETQRELVKLAEAAAHKLAVFRAVEARSQHLAMHCRMLLSASEVVSTNHTRFVLSQKDSFDDFRRRFNSQESFIEHELNEFDHHLDLLRAVPLHPALIQDRRTSLGDLLDGVQLAVCKAKFLTEQTRLREQVAEVEVEVRRLEAKRSERVRPMVGDTVDTSHGVGQMTEVVETYKEYRQLLEQYLPEKDAAAGRRLFEEEWTQRILRLQSLVSRVDFEETRTRLSFEAQKESALTVAHYFLEVMKTSLSSISKIRYGVKSQISMLNSLLKRFEQRMQYLLAPKMLPTAYSAALSEVARRHKFIAKADELRKELLELIDLETSLRMDFWNKYRNVLPNDLIPQLGDAPDRKYLAPKNESDRTLPVIDVPCAVPPGYYLKEARSQFDLLASALEASRKDIESLHTENLTNKSLIAALQTESNHAKSQKHTLESVLLEKDGILQRQTQRLKSLEEEIQVKAEKHTENQAKIASLEQELKSIFDSNETLRVEISRKEKEIEDCKPRFSLDSSVNLLDSLKLPSQPEAGMTALKEKLQQLKAENHKLRKKLQGTIFFTSFPEGALALFFPGSDGHFAAFHYNCPFQFLDLRSIPDPFAASLQYPLHRHKHMILGKITQRSQFIASVEHNPFSLSLGVPFSLLTVELDPRFL